MQWDAQEENGHFFYMHSTCIMHTNMHMSNLITLVHFLRKYHRTLIATLTVDSIICTQIQYWNMNIERVITLLVLLLLH